MDIRNWLIWISDDPRDVWLSWDVPIPEIEVLDDIYFAYNQAKQQKTKYDCTLYAPITAVSNLMNYKFSDDEIMEIVQLSRDRGKKDDSWWYLQQWVDAIYDWWNAKFPDRQIMYFRTDKWSELYYDVMDKKHFVVVGIKGNAALNREKATGALTSDNLNWPSTYGHALCNTKGGSDHKKAVDNYNPNDLKGYNESKEPHPNNEYKVYLNVYKGNIYQASGFVILPKPVDKEEIKRLTRFKDILEESILASKKEWHRLEELKELTNDQIYLENITTAQWHLHRLATEHRAKMDTVLTMLSLDKKDYEHLLPDRKP